VARELSVWAPAGELHQKGRQCAGVSGHLAALGAIFVHFSTTFARAITRFPVNVSEREKNMTFRAEFGAQFGGHVSGNKLRSFGGRATSCGKALESGNWRGSAAGRQSAAQSSWTEDERQTGAGAEQEHEL